MVASLKNDYDLVIVGAGPAGSSTAYFSKLLDKNNSKKILLIESLNKEKFIRYHHMCGEAVSKHIKKDFPNLDISNVIKNKIDNIVEFWGNDTKITSKSPGYIINRSKFLLEIINKFKHKGGQFLENRLINYSQEKDKIKLKLKNGEKLNTKYLIIATGPNRLQDKTLNDTRNHFQILLYQIMIDDYPIKKNCIEFYYNERYKENYKWIFPYGDQVKIGVPYDNKDELKAYSKYGIIRKDVKSVYCGFLSNYNSNNVLFVGDAAYQNNPLTKGGIRNAINAGRMAANSIIIHENPSMYDLLWKRSKFFTKPYLETVRILKKMKNKELMYHSKPLKYYPFSLPIILLKYKKYIPLYKTYISSEKYGW